jgi:hypothetical protein
MDRSTVPSTTPGTPLSRTRYPTSPRRIGLVRLRRARTAADLPTPRTLIAPPAMRACPPPVPGVAASDPSVAVPPAEERGVHHPGAAARVPAIYGFDIETDTTIDGLDPRWARIVAVAVASPDSTVVFSDRDETVLLDRLDWHLASLEPGVLATWNGSAFDLPFVADRARHHGMALGLRLVVDRTIPRRHPPLIGHAGAYRASWHSHAHLDGYQVFRADVAPAFGVSSSLKSVARLCGLAPVELDTTQLHRSPAAMVDAYVASDARCARELVARRWRTARLAVDAPPAVPPVGVPAERAAPARSALS